MNIISKAISLHSYA